MGLNTYLIYSYRVDDHEVKFSAQEYIPILAC